MSESKIQIQHRTSCKQCNLSWVNTDDRNYSNDRCPQCGKVVDHVIEKTVLKVSKGGILPILTYVVEPPTLME